MGSSRFPGKALIDFHGIPMVEHVRRRAVRSGAFSEVVVATCDREIADAVETAGGEVIMTAASHVAATDRVAEAAGHLDCTHVVNVQGDEILVLPEDLRNMVAAIHANPSGVAWNAVAQIENPGELSDSSIVKCVVSRSLRVMSCGRDLSKVRFGPQFNPIRKILGILAFERSFLAKYSSLERTPLEVAESIDQSRIVEHDVPLQGVEFRCGYPGINEPREVALVENYLNKDPLQQAVLSEILVR
jgi:3-deoxy-manno-octulosonate cytidylyltransferase (CMP-KDO synthetase)